MGGETATSASTQRQVEARRAGLLSNAECSIERSWPGNPDEADTCLPEEVEHDKQRDSHDEQHARRGWEQRRRLQPFAGHSVH